MAKRAERPPLCPGFQRIVVAPDPEIFGLYCLFAAKQRLAAGMAPASVAAEVGLVDQSHLTRRFARMYGVTPARYQQQLGLRALRAAA